jgi:AraC-like DNA-binding protein
MLGQPPILALDFEPLNDAPFLASYNLPLNQPTAVDCQFSAGTVVRRPEAIKSGGNIFSFLIAKSSGVCCEQIGRELRSNRGEASLTRHDEPIRIGSPAGFRGINLLMPRAEFDARDIRPDDAVMRCLSPQNEALGLLRAYLQALGKSGVDSAVEFGIATAAREIVQRHIFDFVALAVSWQGAIGESNLASVADARLRAALGYIETHFDDPRLTIEMVARAQGISATYLRRLMKASGRSYLKVVNELRLQKAFTGLSAAGPDDRTILDVAMAAGFSDISNFNRLFRARFEDTPSSVRKKHRSLR